MAKQFVQFDASHVAFIEAQHIFFTASAAPDGRVNVSPKGMDSLRIQDPNRLMWINLTGSGNETAGHLLEHPRVTVMWCSFGKRPLILRAYGTARAIYPDDTEWTAFANQFPTYRSARQIFDMSVDLVQTSCGYAVPHMTFEAERDTLKQWAKGKSDADLLAYRQEKNQMTLDGKPTRRRQPDV